ncbi:PAS domain-containing sensor histidine kinase [Roseospira navarrensis]|nr:PAS domain S-box protein [Roseospira navarrensis]
MDDITLSTLALDNLAEGVLLIDQAGTVIYANQQARVLFEREGRPLEGGAFSAPIRTTDPIEIVIPGGQGADRIVEMRVSPLRSDQDRLSLVSLRDVSERYRAAEQLREREAVYRSVIESAHDGFWITDLSARILEVNTAYLRMTGFAREDVLGSRPQDFDVDADSDAAAVAARVETLIDRGSDVFETRHRTAHGTVIDVELSISYSPVSGGRLFVFLRDITPRKQAEAEILTAKAAAERANRSKSEFLAAMSHDLRTPLNAIMGFSEIMRTEAFGPLGSDRYREYVQGIEDSGALLVSLVNDVLDLSKIEAGKYDLRDEALDLRTLMDRSVVQTSVLGRVADRDLVQVSCPDGLRILGDDRALAQVFNNILSNAIKFNAEDRPIRFEAAFHTDHDPHDGLDIRIIDRGIGMAREEIGKALNPFEMIESQHARRHQGTGLGLHISIQVMQLLGGDLRLDSRPREGTCVTLWLPANRIVMDR